MSSLPASVCNSPFSELCPFFPEREALTWLLAASCPFWDVPTSGVFCTRQTSLCFLHRESPRQGQAPTGGSGGSLVTCVGVTGIPEAWGPQSLGACPALTGLPEGWRRARWAGSCRSSTAHTGLLTRVTLRSVSLALLSCCRFWIKWQHSNSPAKHSFCSCGSHGPRPGLTLLVPVTPPVPGRAAPQASVSATLSSVEGTSDLASPPFPLPSSCCSH